MRTMPFHVPSGLLAWLSRHAHGVGGGAVVALRAIARETRLPVVLVAALALVIVYRIARRGGRLALEIALALVVVLAATRLGWVRW